MSVNEDMKSEKNGKLKKSGQKHSAFEVMKNKRVIAVPVIFTVIVLLMSALYLIYAWNRYEKAAASEAVALAQSLNALLPDDNIAELTGSPEDLNNPAYNELKVNLTSLINVTDSIRFAYLLTEKDGCVIMLIDSEPSESPDYSPPGQELPEANNIYFEIMRKDTTIITEPTQDRWGTWVSVLVPVKDMSSGDMIAIFGLDY
ncbi:MAG: sensor domain-containing phosphodiesterase, partial [Eubacteriales bacterium]|nr:sensor domain-containing phosphodiesterase [Eubacteriales bacterium]